MAVAACRPAPALEPLVPAPAFRLFDQEGRPFTSDQLKGKVVAATLIYTRCPDVCPLLTEHMKDLQRRLRRDGLLGRDAHLVSFSVDPDYDTPAVLRDYAARYGVDTGSWSFLTGPADEVRRVAVDGYKIGVFRAAGGAVSHDDRIILQGRDGHVYAYVHVDAFDSEAASETLRALARR